MRMTDVISIGKSYLALGILCAVVIVALVFVGYKFIYQKKMQGQKKLSWIKLLWLVVMICYLLVVCGATLLGRFLSWHADAAIVCILSGSLGRICCQRLEKSDFKYSDVCALWISAARWNPQNEGVLENVSLRIYRDFGD